LQAHVGTALAHFAFHLFQALHLSHHTKRLGVDETIDQLAALDGAIFVQDDRRHVFDVVVEGVAKRDHLDQRRKKHEEKRHRIAPDDDEFLEKNCAESAKRFAFHITRHSLSSRVAKTTRDLAYAGKASAIDPPTSDSSSPPMRFSYCAASL
jgi:hypothetical protein